MRDVYIVFDQLPHRKDGGLVATYTHFVQEFSDDYNIKIASIFNNGGNDLDAFEDSPIIDFSNFNLDNRFYKALQYLNKRDFSKFFHAVHSVFRFFLFFCVLQF